MTECYMYKTNKDNIADILKTRKPSDKGKTDKQYILETLNSEVGANRKITNYTTYD